MKGTNVWFGGMFLGLLMLSSAAGVNGQSVRETYQGTVVSYGTGVSTRMQTSSFTLIINGQTTDAEALRNLSVLQEGGQDNLLAEIKKQSLGRFSVGPNVGVDVNVVRESMVDGKRRIFVVFERWMRFAEVRGGYRSTDYPFGVIELFIDPSTGRGEGTYIAAARIRWTQDRKTNEYQVEIENFGTFPARLMGVRQVSGPKA